MIIHKNEAFSLFFTQSKKLYLAQSQNEFNTVSTKLAKGDVMVVKQVDNRKKNPMMEETDPEALWTTLFSQMNSTLKHGIEALEGYYSKTTSFHGKTEKNSSIDIPFKELKDKNRFRLNCFV